MKISPYSRVLIREAKKFGIKIHPVGEAGKMFILRRGEKHTFIYQSLTELTSDPMYKISANKYLTNFTLKKFGLPITNFKLGKDINDAKKFLKKYKKIVIKPLSANQGKGITIGIKKASELQEAIDGALKYTVRNKLDSTYKKNFLLEKAVPGDDHRLLVINFKIVFAIKKIPAYVVGDGEGTIKQLIEKKNILKLKHKKPIIIDETLRHVLARQDLRLRDVPKLGQKIFVRRTANLATGGESIDITDDLNPKIKKMAIQAAKIMKMPVAGFDFMCRDYTKSKGFFIEVNPIPGLMIHHFPHIGKPRNPAREIIKMLIKKKLI